MHTMYVPEVMLMKSAQLTILPTATAAPAITRYRVPISFQALGLPRTGGVPFEGGVFPSPLVRHTQDINVSIDAWVVDDAEGWGGREMEAIFLQTVFLWRIFEHPSELIELRGWGFTELTANALPERGGGGERMDCNAITNTMAGQQMRSTVDNGIECS